jgi:2-dehydropantoate 2-reductase
LSGDNILVLGAGAIGSSIAADLIDSGHDVTVVDQWPDHVLAMRSVGLRVTMPDLDLIVPVRAHHVCDLASLQSTFDVIFLCVKAYDSRWSAMLARPYLAVDGVLIGIQNSMTDDENAEIVGRSRTMGCAIELSADLYEPGVVTRNTTRVGTWLTIGELDGHRSDRAVSVAGLLGHVAQTEISQNIYGSKWTKLVANSMVMGPCGLTGLRTGEAARLPGMRRLSVALGQETVAVGRALGYELEPVFGLTAAEVAGGGDEALLRAVDTLRSHIGERALTAVIQDQRKGRRSEWEFISGLVARRGVETGVATPANAAVCVIYRQIEAGLTVPSALNIDRAISLID